MPLKTRARFILLALNCTVHRLNFALSSKVTQLNSHALAHKCPYLPPFVSQVADQYCTCLNLSAEMRRNSDDSLLSYLNLEKLCWFLFYHLYFTCHGQCVLLSPVYKRTLNIVYICHVTAPRKSVGRVPQPRNGSTYAHCQQLLPCWSSKN